MGIHVYIYIGTMVNNTLSPNAILEHLKKVADSETAIAYLESLITAGETESTFHNELIYLYLVQIY